MMVWADPSTWPTTASAGQRFGMQVSPSVRKAGPSGIVWSVLLPACLSPDWQAPDEYSKGLWAHAGAHLPRLRSCSIICGRRQAFVLVVVLCMMLVWQAFGFNCLNPSRI